MDEHNEVLGQLILNLSGVLSPASYLQSLGFEPFPWQMEALQPHNRLILNCLRQAGKSTIISAKSVHRAKYYPGSLILLISPSERQSIELMKKVEEFMSRDSQIELKTNNALEKEFTNRSRIVALPGSEKTVRGFSAPAMIIIDEASRVSDEMFFSLRPMMSGETTKTELVLMSTPFGKRGFFYDSWNRPHRWKRIEVSGRTDYPEERYRADRAREGILAWYSPRHTADFLEEEREAMGDWWFSQEYMCQFVEAQDNVFSLADINAALRDDEEMIMFGEVEDNEEVYEL